MTRSKSNTCRDCGAALSYGTRGRLCRQCWVELQSAGEGPNPPGLCQCGCGRHTSLAKQTCRATGTVRGKPVRFIQGHYSLKTQERYRVEDRGYSGGPCWIWQRHINDQGYGVIRGADRQSRAHRVVYEEMIGPIPEGLELDHLCRVRSCVNPAHLEPVTHAENMRRGNSPASVTRREQRCRRGHDLTLAESVYVVPKTGKRLCRVCQRLRSRGTVVDVERIEQA